MSVPTFFSAETPRAGQSLELDDSVAAHLKTRRIEAGNVVRLTDGAGTFGSGTLRALSSRGATVEVEELTRVSRKAEVHLLVPAADKDRMLLLAEKCVELEATSWRPVLWRRSRSVANRGEGPGFDRRLRARMIAALEQSGGAWLPEVHQTIEADEAIAALGRTAAGARLLLDAAGPERFPERLTSPVTIAVGPEGGLDAEDLAHLSSGGFRPMRIEGNTMRFETAAIAGMVLARMALARETADE